MQEAANLGKKVALLDFVKPSPQGTSWGMYPDQPHLYANVCIKIATTTGTRMMP